MNENELKEKAKKLLADIRIDIIDSDLQMITLLQDLQEKKIENSEIEILEKTINNIENYFYIKSKLYVIQDDVEYLKNIAEILRNQKVRANDGIFFGQPVFKIHTDAEEVFYFITREGAEKFLELNSTAFKKINLLKKNTSSPDKRNINLFEVIKNNNLELEKVIEIIKRNF